MKGFQLTNATAFSIPQSDWNFWSCAKLSFAFFFSFCLSFYWLMGLERISVDQCYCILNSSKWLKLLILCQTKFCFLLFILSFFFIDLRVLKGFQLTNATAFSIPQSDWNFWSCAKLSFAFFFSFCLSFYWLVGLERISVDQCYCILNSSKWLKLLVLCQTKFCFLLFILSFFLLTCGTWKDFSWPMLLHSQFLKVT